MHIGITTQYSHLELSKCTMKNKLKRILRYKIFERILAKITRDKDNKTEFKFLHDKDIFLDTEAADACFGGVTIANSLIFVKIITQQLLSLTS